MLGDVGLAEDVVSEVGIAAVVQERGNTVEASDAQASDAQGSDRNRKAAVRSWPAWLTTVCVRRAIDQSRHLASAKEDYPGPWLPEPVSTEALPEEALANRELLSVTLLHLAEQLTPEARAALILSRAFDVSTEEIAAVLDKSPAAIRQLISRASRRLDLDSPVSRPADKRTLGHLIDAIHSGDQSTALRLLLTDDAIFWSDGGGLVPSTRNPIFGADRIVRFLTAVINPQDTNSQHCSGVIEINGGLAIVVEKEGSARILEVEVDAAGQVRGLRQVNNPNKLGRI